jgi:hypothetical protein
MRLFTGCRFIEAVEVAEADKTPRVKIGRSRPRKPKV